MQKSLNDITEEDIAMVEDLAGLFFIPKEIALMLELPEADMQNEMMNPGSMIYIAFQKGRLQKEVDLRRSITKLANAGSSPAQTMALDLLNKSTKKML